MGAGMRETMWALWAAQRPSKRLPGTPVDPGCAALRCEEERRARCRWKHPLPSRFLVPLAGNTSRRGHSQLRGQLHLARPSAAHLHFATFFDTPGYPPAGGPGTRLAQDGIPGAPHLKVIPRLDSTSTFSLFLKLLQGGWAASGAGAHRPVSR